MDAQTISPVSAPVKNFTQTITFKDCDVDCSSEIVATDVNVICSSGNHNHGSSKVKLTNLVDFNWEQKYYNGHLLSVHVSGKYFAYGIKGRGGGMVRVATHDSRMRALIKEMKGEVEDIAFAHIYNVVMLACVDDEGSLFVYTIEEKEKELSCTINLHILQVEEPTTRQNIHRVVWCPFLPEEGETEDDASRLLVLTHGNKAELINVAIINTNYGSGPTRISDLTEGYLEINEHTDSITDAAFSPDGTAVATAGADGYVKFFQIYMHEGTKPRCLHEWKPHNGKPLSYLCFLDNHSIFASEEQFWKFAITGSNNNTELKIWSCESWTCLQTIVFKPHPLTPSLDLFLKARLNITSDYLIMSDINNRIVYFLEMYRGREGNAFAKTITEFFVPAPVISFAILEATLQKFRCSNSTEELYPVCDGLGDDSTVADEFDPAEEMIAIVVRMFIIQPKRLQECQIVFQPTFTSYELLIGGGTSSSSGGDGGGGDKELDLQQKQSSVTSATVAAAVAAATAAAAAALNSNKMMTKTLNIEVEQKMVNDSNDRHHNDHEQELIIDDDDDDDDDDIIIENDDTNEQEQQQQQIIQIQGDDGGCIDNDEQQQQQQQQLITAIDDDDDIDIVNEELINEAAKNLNLVRNVLTNYSASNLLIQPSAPPNPPLNLMTPDAFNSPVKSDQQQQQQQLLTNSDETTAQTIDKATVGIIDSDSAVIVVTSNNTGGGGGGGGTKDNNNFASGGSSPSREVQEILSLNKNNYNAHEYYENGVKEVLNVGGSTTTTATLDELCLTQQSTGGGGGGVGGGVDNDLDDNNGANKTGNNSCNSSSNKVPLGTDGWPAVPVLKGRDVVKSSSTDDQQQQQQQQPSPSSNGQTIIATIHHLHHQQQHNSQNRSSASSTPHQHQHYLSQQQQQQQQQPNNEEFQKLQEWIVSLIGLVREQTNQLDQLQNELKAIKHEQKKYVSAQELETILTSQLDVAFGRNQLQQNKHMDNWFTTKLNKDLEHHENLTMNLQHVTSKQIQDKLQSIISQEVKQNVLPFIVATFENLKHMLKEDFNNRLAVTDQMLRENMNKFVSSKAVVEAIGNSVSSGLRSNIEKTFREVISQTLIPCMDQLCTTIVRQMSDVFTQGTKEYTQALENHLDKSHRRSLDKNEKIVGQMQTVCDTLRTNTEKISQTVPAELNKQIVASFQTIQDKLIGTMNELIRDQIASAFRNHASILEDSVINAVRSRAVTPSPHDTQMQLAQIQSLLTQGHINSAFQQALSASDLSLVVYICERVNPQTFFSQQPCPIQQHVLLSLIQQLSADMTTHTELKTKYLENAVLNLDPANVNTKAHMQPVLKDLHRQLATFIASNPTHKCNLQFKMLTMAIKSLLNS